ncbi:hypothetical protein ACFE04_025027 [Oxalis oulophora]
MKHGSRDNDMKQERKEDLPCVQNENKYMSRVTPPKDGVPTEGMIATDKMQHGSKDNDMKQERKEDLPCVQNENKYMSRVTPPKDGVPSEGMIATIETWAIGELAQRD